MLSFLNSVMILFSQKCGEIKNSKVTTKDKIKNIFLFFILFVEKNKEFARLLSREALFIR